MFSITVHVSIKFIITIVKITILQPFNNFTKSKSPLPWFQLILTINTSGGGARSHWTQLSFAWTASGGVRGESSASPPKVFSSLEGSALTLHRVCDIPRPRSRFWGRRCLERPAKVSDAYIYTYMHQAMTGSARACIYICTGRQEGSLIQDGTACISYAQYRNYTWTYVCLREMRVSPRGQETRLLRSNRQLDQFNPSGKSQR